MNRSRYTGKRRRVSAQGKAHGRPAAVLIAVILLLALAIGGTVAWISARTAPIQNEFLPSEVSCEVTEQFDSATGVKRDINVRNTGDIDAFIRVRLVSYRTNEAGQHIGGVAELPTFTLGEGWVKYSGYYYYTHPVAPGSMPASSLTDAMQLTDSYADADGGRQAIDVLAEAIQSVPTEAIDQAWGVRISQGSVTANGGN